MVTALSDPQLGWLLATALSYPEVGATAGGPDRLPAGYRRLHRTATLGSGPDTFAAAGDALLSWRMHERAGLIVLASAPTATEGAVVVTKVGFGPLRISAPSRVVYEIAEPTRRGFAYGTLAGHPEQGEEAFVVELLADQRVTVTVTAFSRPARWFTRLGGPLARLIQDRVTDRYLASLRRP
ncbi:MAG: DUF1990 domain-containing protein [Sporichthyaceae bacterium]|nr:DUF1990 domain-containing protein [Sporichthyaceae bacterium]